MSPPDAERRHHLAAVVFADLVRAHGVGRPARHCNAEPHPQRGLLQHQY